MRIQKISEVRKGIFFSVFSRDGTAMHMNFHHLSGIPVRCIAGSHQGAYLADVMFSNISFLFPLLVFSLSHCFFSVIFVFISVFFYFGCLLEWRLFFGLRISWNDGIHTSLSSLAFWLWGTFTQRDFFLSQHGIGAASILASLSLPIADGSNLGLDGKDGNCAAFSLLFSIV